MLCTVKNTGFVSYIHEANLKFGGNAHAWTETKTVDFNSDKTTLVREESFYGDLARNRNLRDGETITTKHEVSEIAYPTKDNEDYYPILEELLSEILKINNKKFKTKIKNWEQFKKIENRVSLLKIMLSKTDLMGNINGLDVFVIPQENKVVEIYYHWTNGKGTFEYEECELL